MWKPFSPHNPLPPLGKKGAEGRGRGPQDRGVVLILVLFMILLLTGVITRFVLTSRAFLRQTEIYAHSLSALYIARAAISIAKVALVESLQMASQTGMNVVTTAQPWATPIINYPVANAGFVSGLVTDEAGKFNINMLTGVGGSIDPHRLIQFTRLFTSVGADPALLPAISQWVTPAPNMTGPPGPYGGFVPPYRNRGGPMDVLSELHQIAGMTEAAYQALEPYLTVYTPGQINVNTASPLVLAALDPGITPAIAEQIVARRPFLTLAQFQQTVGPSIFANISGDVTLTSQIFSVSAVGIAGETKVAIRAVLSVNGMQTQTLTYRIGGNRLLYQIDTLLRNAPLPPAGGEAPTIPTLPAGGGS